jgi:hypothetical protein
MTFALVFPFPPTTEVKFSGYEAFALLAATMLLEHGLPQVAAGTVVGTSRGLISRIEDFNILLWRGSSATKSKRAIFRTLGAQGERVDELRFRIKRLLVTDRHSGCDAHSEEGRQ